MITLKKIEEKHLTDLYDVIYSSEEPEWSKYNAPYFNECKCQNKSVNKFQDKNVQKIYNIDILKKGDIYDIRNKNTN